MAQVGFSARCTMTWSRLVSLDTTFLRMPYVSREPFGHQRLEFRLGDAAKDPEHFDVMLVIDVIEHVPDPVGFLASVTRQISAILHIPLDLSVQSVLRSDKLMERRRHAGTSTTSRPRQPPPPSKTPAIG